MDFAFSTSTSMSARLVLDALVGADRACRRRSRIFAYSSVMSSTFWAPPHISAQSATVARSSTRASGGHASPWRAPSSASAPTVDVAGAPPRRACASGPSSGSSLTVDALACPPGRGRGSRRPRASCPRPRPRGHHEGVRGVRVGHEELGAGQRRTAALARAWRRSVTPAASQRRARLRHRRASTRAWPAAMRGSHSFFCAVGARLEDGEAAQEHGGEERPGHHGAAHLLHEHDREVDEARAPCRRTPRGR